MLAKRLLYFAVIYSVYITKCHGTCETYPWTQWSLCVENDQEYRVREAQDIDACTALPCNDSTVEHREYQCSMLLQTPPDVDQIIKTIRTELLSNDPNITTVAEHVTKGRASDRMSMRRYYKAAYGSDLITDLSEAFADIVGNDCWMSLIGGTTDHLTTSLKPLIQLGDSDHVSALLITNANEELKRVQLQYKLETGESLDQGIAQRFPADEARVLRSLASAQRDEYGTANVADVEDDAYALREATLASNTDELLRILGAKDTTHLNEVFNQYKSVYGRWVQYHIKRKITGSVQSCFLNIVDYISDEAKFCAVKVFFALGLATDTTLDDGAVETTMVDCAKVNMCNIALKYQEIYNRNLANDVEANYHGTCAQLLVPLARI